MTVNGWDEVYGDKLTLSNNQGDKFRQIQLLVGRQDSDLSKITVMWHVCEGLLNDRRHFTNHWFIIHEDSQRKSMIFEPE